MNWSRGIVAVLCVVLVGNALGQETATKRGLKEIRADMDAVEAKLNELFPSEEEIPEKFMDAKFRKENGAKLAPLFMQLANLYGEVIASEERIEGRWGKALCEPARQLMLMMAMALGDKDAEKVLTEIASKETYLVAFTKRLLVQGNWLKNAEDAKVQQKVLDDFAAVAKANPKDQDVANMLRMMARTAANKETADKVVEAIKTNLKEDLAKSTIAALEADKAKQAKKDAESKPQGE